MAKVAAFQISGVTAWFWSNDHDPPHFHAKHSDEWEVKVHFLLPPEQMIEIVWQNKKPSAKLLKELCRLADENRPALLEQWEQIQGAA